MGTNSVDGISMSNVVEASETTIEIKIKTLDSQTISMRVNKQMPVPELKEQIASVTGVLSEQQRLICRGRVLRDDQLLSAYHVEDGHTLHMVVRQPIPPSSESMPHHPGLDPSSHTGHGQRIQVAPGVVVEAFDITDQGDGVPPDINRIVSAVLGAFGINDTGNANSGVDVNPHDSGHERAMGGSGAAASNLSQPEAGFTGQSDRSYGTFGFPTAFSLGSLEPHVIPDSLTTLSQYLSHMRQEYNAIAQDFGTPRSELNSIPPSLSTNEGLPTAEQLARVLLSTREVLIEQISECLNQLVVQLHNQSNVTDPMARLRTQYNAWRSGTLFQNLGAYLLELGRATMTLRIGQTSSEAVVNAGPAVFISESGPNPLMVQPLPFQPGTSFGVIPANTGQAGSSLVNDNVAGFLPRRIDIQIRRGSSIGRGNVDQEQNAASEQPSGPGNPPMGSGGAARVNPAAAEGLSHAAGSRVRVVPLRTRVTSIAGPHDGLPGLGRYRHVASGHLSSRRGFQPFGEHQSSGPHNERHPSSESGVQQSASDNARDGSTNSAVEQGPVPAPTSRRFRFSVLSTGASENNQPSERDVPAEVFQVLRSVFPGGEIHIEDAGLQRAAPVSASGTVGATSTSTDAHQAERRVTDEGVFLSNLLQEIMPVISRVTDVAPDDVSAEPANASEQRTADDSSADAENSDIGTSRRQSDAQPSHPNSKRQKME